MQRMKFDRDLLWFPRDIEKLRGEVAVAENQLAQLEQKNLRSSFLLQKLGVYFGFGAAGKLDWARYKISFKKKRLADCVATYDGTWRKCRSKIEQLIRQYSKYGEFQFGMNLLVTAKQVHLKTSVVRILHEHSALI